jgi:hypothetical protein
VGEPAASSSATAVRSRTVTSARVSRRTGRSTVVGRRRGLQPLCRQGPQPWRHFLGCADNALTLTGRHCFYLALLIGRLVRFISSILASSLCCDKTLHRHHEASAKCKNPVRRALLRAHRRPKITATRQLASVAAHLFISLTETRHRHSRVVQPHRQGSGHKQDNVRSVVVDLHQVSRPPWRNSAFKTLRSSRHWSLKNPPRTSCVWRR